MDLRKFKSLVKMYCGHYERDAKNEHRAWWDVYDRDGLHRMYVCYGRMIELTGNGGSVNLLGNTIRWSTK